MTTTHQASTSETTNNKDKDESAGGCCGGPAPVDTNACCVKDAAAKAAGETGCGCGPRSATAKKSCC